MMDFGHWIDDCFSFTSTRDVAFRFDNRQIAILGLPPVLEYAFDDKQRTVAAVKPASTPRARRVPDD